MAEAWEGNGYHICHHVVYKSVCFWELVVLVKRDLLKVYSVAAFLVFWLALFIQPNNLTVGALDIVLVSSLSPLFFLSWTRQERSYCFVTKSWEWATSHLLCNYWEQFLLLTVHFLSSQLHLYDIETQSRTSLLSYCSYVQVGANMILLWRRCNMDTA